MATWAEDFRDQILGILQSAESPEGEAIAHQAWTTEMLALLQAADRGEQTQLPDLANSQLEAARLLLLACGLEGSPRPEGQGGQGGQGREVQLAIPIVSEYLEKLAQKGLEGKDSVQDSQVSDSMSDILMAEMLSKTLQEEEARKARCGELVSHEKLAELGAAFERQPFGSDTCAIHSLNNLLQPKRSSEEAAAKLQEALAAALKDEQNDEKESWASTLGLVGPFSMSTLQAAEAESREEEMANRGFLAPRVAQLSLLRADSGLSWGGEQRTGMFDVEAVKLAARSKGFEVIDVEPKPTWKDSEVSSYVAAARSFQEPWFRGFLVYERIPGRAMHYYSILHWPGDSWILLDSLDRGDESPRNRLLTLEDVVQLHDENAEFFRSWLLRWYPVVDRRAAVSSLQEALRKTVAVREDDRLDVGSLLSDVHAERELDESRWNVELTAQRLLEAPRQVSGELKVLQLLVTEKEARASLEATGWDFLQAVSHQSERLRKKAGERENRTCEASFAALSLTDWDIHLSAQVLLLKDQAEALGINVSLSAAASALKAAHELPQALLIVQLIAEIQKEHKDQKVDEAFAASLLRHAASVDSARQIAEILHEFPSVPLPICAEALRRGEGQSGACSLLKDFQDRVCSLVASQSSRVKGEQRTSLTREECQEISRLAVEAAEWSPDLSFTLAESYALAVLQVRREIGALQQRERGEAFAALQKEESPGELASALSSLDAANELQNLPPAALLAQLQDCEMNPAQTARQLWAQQTGRGGGYEAPGKTERAPPKQRSPRKRLRNGRNGKEKDCVLM